MYIYNTTGNSSQAKGQVTIDMDSHRTLNISEIREKILQSNNGSLSLQNLSLSLANKTGISTN